MEKQHQTIHGSVDLLSPSTDPLKVIVEVALPETNITPEHQWLEDEIEMSVWDTLFLRKHVVFVGGSYSSQLMVKESPKPPTQTNN